MVSVLVEKPLKALVLGVEGDGEEVKWSDNGFDIMPGDVLEVHRQPGKCLRKPLSKKGQPSESKDFRRMYQSFSP